MIKVPLRSSPSCLNLLYMLSAENKIPSNGVLTSLGAGPILVLMKLYTIEIDACDYRCPHFVKTLSRVFCSAKADADYRVDDKYNVEPWQKPPEWCPLPDATPPK